MSYSLGQAARVTGLSKSTISRAIRAGKLSALRNPDGSVAIDPAESARAYPETLPTGPGNGRMARSAIPDRNTATLVELLAEQAETIRDLRNRLDQEAAERREMAEERPRLTAILTDQRPKWRLWRRLRWAIRPG
jgi:excisionase family DNA binding protein